MTTRRNLLKAAPLAMTAAVLPALPAMAAADDTHVGRLFAEWSQAVTEANRCFECDADAAAEAAMARAEKAASTMAGVEPVTLTDLAQMLVVWWGVFPDGLDDDMGEHWALGEPIRRHAIQFSGLTAARSASLVTEDRTEALIAEHKAAHGAFDAACKATDSVVIGREPTLKEWAVWENHQQADAAALEAICAYAPPTLAGRQMKADYLAAYLDRASLSNSEVRALISAAIKV